MQEEKFKRIVETILKKNGKNEWIVGFNLDEINFSYKSCVVNNRCKFKISDKITAYFITYTWTGSNECNNEMYFKINDLNSLIYRSYCENESFQRIYKAKEQYIDYLLKDFLED